MKKAESEEVASAGAILVFLPGWEDIKRLTCVLEEQLTPRGRWHILPLHSQVPPPALRMSSFLEFRISISVAMRVRNFKAVGTSRGA